jgi:hypothetical protein
MAKFCGNCGSPLKDIAIFCGGCGAKVPATRAAATSAAPVDTTPVPPVQDPASRVPDPATDPAAWAPVPGTYAPPAATSAPVPASFTPEPAAPIQDPAPWTPAPTSYSPPPATYSPSPTTSAPAPAAYTPGTAYPAKKSNTLLKVAVVLVVFLFVGGALALAGLWYAAQKINAKAHAAAAHALGGSPAGSALGSLLSSATASDSSSDSPGGFKGDPCRFLSKAEVSRAVGVQIIRSDGTDNGCSYIAKGDPADATAKHMSSMIGGLGADANTQKTIQKIAGGMFAQQEASDKDLAAQAAKGEIAVLGVLFTSGNAQMEMKMNRGAFQHVTGGAGTAANSGSGDLDGIGDEAYLAGGGMLMFRKGNTMARLTYIGCPCNTDNIKPLAKLMASRL